MREMKLTEMTPSPYMRQVRRREVTLSLSDANIKSRNRRMHLSSGYIHMTRVIVPVIGSPNHEKEYVGPAFSPDRFPGRTVSRRQPGELSRLF